MFRLNIECSKDIDEIHINFSDGSSSVTTKPSKVQTEEKVNAVNETPKSKSQLRKDALLDTDAEFGNVSQEVVKLPEINMDSRPVKVASELQNLDI